MNETRQHQCDGMGKAGRCNGHRHGKRGCGGGQGKGIRGGNHGRQGQGAPQGENCAKCADRTAAPDALYPEKEMGIVDVSPAS